VALPVDQIVIGFFALATAMVTGFLAIYNTKVSKRLNKTEEKTTTNVLLETENNVVEKLLPVLERKDDALDKIAEILDNILRVQTLQSTQMKSLESVVAQRCLAVELIKAVKRLEELQSRQNKINNAVENSDNTKDLIEQLIEPFDSENLKTEKGGGQ
jgi:hypothetical protein